MAVVCEVRFEMALEVLEKIIKSRKCIFVAIITAWK